MSITLERDEVWQLPDLQSVSPRPETASLDWRSPARNLWVARSSAGDYVGMVERIDADFIVTTGSGLWLGSFPTLREAESALATSGARPVRSNAWLMIAAALAGLSASIASVVGILTLSH